VIIFVPTKATGFCLSESLVLPFHCADIDAEDKDKIVHDFNEGTLKHIIATSTLSQGVNTPADVVVVCGTRRGGYYLEYMDVGQMMGRAGRNKPEALAYLMGDKVELFHAKKMNMVKSLPFPVEELALTVLAKDTITREKLISHFRTTFASFVNRKTSVEEVAGKYLHFLNRCHLLQERAGEYALTREGALIARYYISPKMYMKYITLARTIDACDWSPSLQPEEEERTKGCIILSVLLPYFGQIECPSRLEKDILMRLIPMELEKEVSASKAGTVRHFIQRPSAIPDFLRYQLRDIERWLGMFADFERYQVHEKVPGVILLKRTFLDLKTAAAKAAAKKKQKAAIKGGT
jgi:replicative superfamily II helicase